MNRDGYWIQAQLGLKRIIDLTAALLGLVASLPSILVVALAIKLDSPGPVFYRHKRIGKDGRPFDLYKFRTMVTGGDDASYMKYLKQLIESERDGDGNGMPYSKMKDDSRVTRVGRILRCYYLDELPQLFNILKGEMSLVGPRPHVQFEVDHYTPDQMRRLTVKPGATGLWQVAGKANCTFSELLALDLDYIDHWSLGEDFKIVFTTMTIMLNGGEKFWTRTNKQVPQSDPPATQPPASGSSPANGKNAKVHRPKLPTQIKKILPWGSHDLINPVGRLEE